jgi:heat shock protein HtpX
MGEPLQDPIARRKASLRLAAGVALAGFILNAGLVVLVVGALSSSIPTAIVALGLLAAVVLLLGLVAEPFIMRMSGARPLLDGEYPWLRSLVEDLARQTNSTAPRLYIADQAPYNAFAIGTGSNAKIAFYSGLLRDFPEDEVRAVAAHELGHSAKS